MKCEKCVNMHIHSEIKEDVPLSAKVHCMFCSSCRKELCLYYKVLESMEDPLELTVPKDFSEMIMAEINRKEEVSEETKAVTLWKWILAGIFIFLSLVVASVAKPYILARSAYGEAFLMPLNIVLGISISVYVIFFILSHMDELSEFLNLKNRW